MLLRNLAAVVCLLLSVAPLMALDANQANAYDDAWQSQWVTHCKNIYSTTGKTLGFTLQVGDSITHANPYSQWPRYGAGKTTEDTAIITWIGGGIAFSGTTTDVANANGFYLAVTDTSGVRGMTASGGMDTAEFLSGSGNGGTAMPGSTTAVTARGLIADGATYDRNLHITSLISAFSAAQFAVVMLGTNDLGTRTAAQVKTNLGSIITAFEAQNIVVILSTIPPHYDSTTDVTAAAYSDAIRALAQERSLPLIDFRAEILARRPGTSWNGTLLGTNDVHPTAGVGGYNAASDPYANGGDPATHSTGAACANSGYLLRSWLTIQKMKEIKTRVIDTVAPPANTAPVANSQSVSTSENTARSITLTGSDADLDSLTFAIVTPPTHGALTGSGATLTYAPTAGYSGSDSFTFRVNDGTVNSSDATVSITVTPSPAGTPPAAQQSNGSSGGCGAGSLVSFILVALSLSLRYVPCAGVTGRTRGSQPDCNVG